LFPARIASALDFIIMPSLLRKLLHGDPVVVVSGLPRSGTSMAMKMIEAGGVTPVTDGLRSADEDNPKGYYEDERVKDLAKMQDKTWLRAARGRAIKVISHLLKELPDDNNYRVVFMNRKVDEVLKSQAKMLERRGEESGPADDQMRELLQSDVWRAKYLLKNQARFEWLELHYSDVLADPRAHAERMNEFLGGRLDVDKMAAMVDAKLYRNRA